MAERAAHRRLYGVYRNHYTDDPSVKDLPRSAANTHLYWHGGKLLTLKEDSLPWAIHPHTLETEGMWDFYGKCTATSMSAHPKIDPVTGEMIAYGYQAKGDLTDDIASYIIGKDGHIKHEVWFKAPYVGIQHDIAITQNYILFPVIPRTTSDARLRSGEPMWEWDGSKPTYIGILPRTGSGKDVRWFKGPARNTLHFLNAVEHKDGKITMDLPTSSGERDPSQMRRWTFDMKSRKKDTFDEEVISTANGVLARMDDRYLSLPYKYCFVGNRDPEPAVRQGARRRHGRIRDQPVPARRRHQPDGQAGGVLCRARCRACRKAASCRAREARQKATAICWALPATTRPCPATW